MLSQDPGRGLREPEPQELTTLPPIEPEGGGRYPAAPRACVMGLGSKALNGVANKVRLPLCSVMSLSVPGVYCPQGRGYEQKTDWIRKDQCSLRHQPFQRHGGPTNSCSAGVSGTLLAEMGSIPKG